MRKLSDEQKIEIVEKYNTGNFSCKDLSLYYNVSSSSIRSILKVRGIKLKNRTKYISNQNYFDIIDTEEKAYILGFLYADGYNNQTEYYIKIELQEKDRDILELIAKSLNSNSPIRFRKKRTETSQNTLVLKICGKYLSTKLGELGCFENKSLKLKFPTSDQVPDYLIRHFIRGFWDGDGHISMHKHRFYCSSLSTEDFCNALSDCIKNYLDIIPTISNINNANILTKRIDFGGNQKCFKVANWLYEDCSIYMLRKYNAYQNAKLFLSENSLINHPNNYINFCNKIEKSKRIFEYPEELPNHRDFINLLEEPIKKYNLLTPIKYAGKNLSGGRQINYWLCKCDCGNFIEVKIDSIRGGTTKSCGCLGNKNL